MSTPLSPTQDSVLNRGMPLSPQQADQYNVEAVTLTATVDQNSANPSPSGSAVKRKSVDDQENVSPSKSRHTRVRSGVELSPLKILSEQRVTSQSSEGSALSSLSLSRSPRKGSPVKRFPVKVSNPLTEVQEVVPEPRTMTLDDAMKENAGLKKAIEIFEDDLSMLEGTDTLALDAHDETAGPDDTMISTFSAFSAVPTTLGNINYSPARAGGLSSRAQPSPSERPRPSPRIDLENSTANLLMDFTEQLRNPQKSPTRRNFLTSRHSPAVSATPSRQLGNLIDFDIPPMPTPRSVPSITPRELETLKSNFLSEISSLKASLSGKEAEVSSLKTAVGDAEKRVGQSLEKLREEQIAKDQLTEELQDWENRGREMENVLRKVKEEIAKGQQEKEELDQKLEESEKRREAAEMLHQEAESKMAGMRAGRDSDKSSAASSPDKPKGPATSNHEIEVAVERVARELHGLYKSKHETKVAALKKSYESRWQKKIKELESRIEDVNRDNKRLRAERDSTAAKMDPNCTIMEAEELKSQAVKDSTAMKELNADVQRLEAVVKTVQKDNEELRGMLEQERIEKGELVQLAEEMMNMQSFVGSSSSAPPPKSPSKPAPQPHAQPQMPRTQRTPAPQRYQQHHAEAPPAKTPRATPGNRASGLRAPGTVSRAPHERTKSAGGLPRPGGVARSGIMSSIEKMGSYRGRGAE
ncbi:unnamed protein product [Clonostachys chloroleuca]|uniref:Kinetoplast-associated protein KAP n=1 Tax=Clonostachys chloroleuca TaxID=1926264 RepID=A0AA35QDK3_9HYPO|nr:unnamed protein product [Clonostachys chloroleuca]